MVLYSIFSTYDAAVKLTREGYIIGTTEIILSFGNKKRKKLTTYCFELLVSIVIPVLILNSTALVLHSVLK